MRKKRFSRRMLFIFLSLSLATFSGIMFTTVAYANIFSASAEVEPTYTVEKHEKNLLIETNMDVYINGVKVN